MKRLWSMPRMWSIVAREVAEVDRGFGDVVAEVVGAAVLDAGADAGDRRDFD